MNILIVNDDGIHAPGIRLLAGKLKHKHNVTVVAPESERSAASHSYSFTLPLNLKMFAEHKEYEGVNAYTTNGTPCDCVFLGLQNICNNNVDLILAGINAGANLGTDILASGTVNAALEGVMHGVPSLAVSQEIQKLVSFDDYNRYYEYDAEFIEHFIETEDLSQFTDHILSINFPYADASEIKGIAVSPVGISQNDFFYHAQEDYVGRTHYWVDVKRTEKKYNDENKTDDYSLRKKFIVMTPIKYDVTAKELLDIYAVKYNREY